MAKAPKAVDEEGKEAYPLRMGEKVYNTRKEAGTAFKEAILKNLSAIMTGQEVALGEYRGLKLSVTYNDFRKIPQACLQFHFLLNQRISGAKCLYFRIVKSKHVKTEKVRNAEF